ncbi:MAG: tetratricopeptide repeat protein [Candidatus Krumholzibacteria bacterium]|nr:tetratricopeptide repeat protein [Candidatus Krumholzibacteria bacterium]
MNRPVIRLLIVVSVFAATLVFGGCWGRNFWNAPEATLAIDSKMDSLLEENALLQRRIYHLETMLEGQQEQLRRSGARSSMDLEEIKDQINALYVLLEEEQQAPVQRSVRHPSTQTRVIPDTVSSPDPLLVTGDGAVSSSDSAAAAAAVPAPEEMYRQIYLDFSRMEYEIALEESEEFLREYPGDPMTEDVRYVRGECYLELDKDHDALREFSTILQDYPRGKKTPAVLLRMAITYDRTGDSELARGVADRLIREYPDSEEAAEARERFGDSPDEQ